jgi:hypothetical protein
MEFGRIASILHAKTCFGKLRKGRIEGEGKKREPAVAGATEKGKTGHRR